MNDIKLHVGFKVLFLTKGSECADKNSTWVLYRRKSIYNLLWKMGCVGDLILLGLIGVLRKIKKNIYLEKYKKTFLIDCKNNIQKEIVENGNIVDGFKLDSIKLNIEIIKLILQGQSIARELKKYYKIKTPEDYSLLIDYSWFYALIENEVSKMSDFKLMVAKDISPYSGAFISVAKNRNKIVSIYSIKGMIAEDGIILNNEVFDNIFVATENEKIKYSEWGRSVYYSIGGKINKFEEFDGSKLNVGILLSSHAGRWNINIIEEKIDISIRYLQKIYDVNSIIIRPHPNEYGIMKKIDLSNGGKYNIHDGKLDEFIERIDFAVCGGTSSAIQVLEAGKVVLYDSTIDCYYPDTHKMFLDGICIQLGDNKSLEYIIDYYNSNLFKEKFSKHVNIKIEDNSLKKLGEIFS